MLAGRAPLGAPRKPPLSVFLMKVSGDFPDQTDTLSPSFHPSPSFRSDFPDSGDPLQVNRERERAVWISPSPPLSGDIFLSRKVNLAYLDLKKVRRLSWVGWGGEGARGSVRLLGRRENLKREERGKKKKGLTAAEARPLRGSDCGVFRRYHYPLSYGFCSPYLAPFAS